MELHLARHDRNRRDFYDGEHAFASHAGINPSALQNEAKKERERTLDCVFIKTRFQISSQLSYVERGSVYRNLRNKQSKGNCEKELGAKATWRIATSHTPKIVFISTTNDLAILKPSNLCSYQKKLLYRLPNRAR